MDKEIKRKWIEALRSGDYQQATGILKIQRDEGRTAHCCLGVLCEIAVNEGIVEWLYDEGSRVYSFVLNGDGSTLLEEGLLPPPVVEWAGLDSPDPNIHDDKDRPLTDYNDNLRYSFDEIADVIEEFF